MTENTPKRHVRLVTFNGVRVDGRQYSHPRLLGHVGHVVEVEVGRVSGHPCGAVALVRTAEGGTEIGPAYCAVDTLADVASPMLRRIQSELAAGRPAAA